MNTNDSSLEFWQLVQSCQKFARMPLPQSGFISPDNSLGKMGKFPGARGGFGILSERPIFSRQNGAKIYEMKLFRSCVQSALHILRSIDGTLIGVRMGESALPNQQHRHSTSQLILHLSIHFFIMRMYKASDCHSFSVRPLWRCTV